MEVLAYERICLLDVKLKKAKKLCFKLLIICYFAIKSHLIRNSKTLKLFHGLIFEVFKHGISFTSKLTSSFSAF